MDFVVLLIFLAILYDILTKDKPEIDLPLQTDAELFIFKQNKKGYLKSEIWKETRNKILFRDNYTCQSCGTKDTQLHVHHLSDYNRLGNERHEKLITLCPDCHTAWHQKYGYPITYEDYINWNFSLKTVKHLDKPT